MNLFSANIYTFGKDDICTWVSVNSHAKNLAIVKFVYSSKQREAMLVFHFEREWLVWKQQDYFQCLMKVKMVITSGDICQSSVEKKPFG